jgi:DNA uptake protein ComE-like DNA-binding protein
MPTANERKALWFLALVALSGTGVRLFRAGVSTPVLADSAALDRQISRVDSVRAERRRPVARPPSSRASGGQGNVGTSPVDPIDLDRADAPTIETLPGIGPALATRIVQHRDSAGSFGSMDAVCEVRGVGPALAKKLAPLVTFTAPRRPVNDVCDDASKNARKTRASGGRQPR